MSKWPKVLGKSKYRKLSVYIPGFFLILLAAIIIWSAFQQPPKEKEVTIVAALINEDSSINLAPTILAPTIIIIFICVGVMYVAIVLIRRFFE